MMFLKVIFAAALLLQGCGSIIWSVEMVTSRDAAPTKSQPEKKLDDGDDDRADVGDPNLNDFITDLDGLEDQNEKLPTNTRVADVKVECDDRETDAECGSRAFKSCNQNFKIGVKRYLINGDDLLDGSRQHPLPEPDVVHSRVWHFECVVEK